MKHMYIPKTFQGEKFFIAKNKNEAFGSYDSFFEAEEALKRFEKWAFESPTIFGEEFKEIRFIVKVGPKGKEIVWNR